MENTDTLSIVASVCRVSVSQQAWLSRLPNGLGQRGSHAKGDNYKKTKKIML